MIVKLITVFCLMSTLSFAQGASADPFGEVSSSAEEMSSSSMEAPAQNAQISAQALSSSQSQVPKVTDSNLIKKFENLKGEMNEPESAAPETLSVWSLMLQMALGLILVVGLIWFSIWGLKKLQQAKTAVQGGVQGLQILDQIYLGNQQRVVVVRMADKIAALGVTQQNVTFLMDLSNEEAYGNVNAEQFSQSVDFFLNRFKKNPHEPAVREDLL